MKNLTLIALLLFSFISLTAQEKKDANAFIKEGNDAYKVKKYDEAYNSFKQAVTLLEVENKVDTPLVYNTGYCAYKSKKYEEALPYFNKSIEFNYKKSKPYIYKAQILSKQKNYKEMEITLTEGLKLYEKDKNLNVLMSLCFFKQGLVFFNQGNKIKKAANESGLNKTDSVKFKAEYAKADAKFQEALPFMEKSYQYNPKNKNVLKALVNIYTNIDMKDKAEKMKKELKAEEESVPPPPYGTPDEKQIFEEGDYLSVSYIYNCYNGKYRNVTYKKTKDSKWKKSEFTGNCVK